MFPNIFISLSIVINGRSPQHENLIRRCSPERLLAESDYNNIKECSRHTWEIVQKIAEIKGWAVETEDWLEDDGTLEAQWGVVRRLEANFQRFIGPGLGIIPQKESRKVQKRNNPSHKRNGDWESEEEEAGTDVEEAEVSQT